MPATKDDDYSPFEMAYRDWLVSIYQQTYDAQGSWPRVAETLGRAIGKVNRDIKYLKKFGITFDLTANRRVRKDGDGDEAEAGEGGDAAAEEGDLDPGQPANAEG